MTHRTDHRQASRAEEAVHLGRLAMRSERERDVHTVHLAGELDLANGQDVEDELLRVEATDVPSIVIDLSELTFIDSTGIRLLVTADARARKDSERLSILRGPPSVQRVFELCGVAAILPFAD